VYPERPSRALTIRKWDWVRMVDESSIEALAEAHPDVVADLRKLDPITTAATFAGLLTNS
jgi:hypothetical protein